MHTPPLFPHCTVAALGVGVGALYVTGRWPNWTTARPNGEVMGITALSAGDMAAFFSAYNPSLMTTGAFRRKGGEEAENTKRDLYRGAMTGTALGLVVALGGSAVTRSWWPTIGAVGVAAVQWGILRYTIENPWGKYGSIAHQPPGSG